MTWGEYIDFETMEAKEEARKEGHAEGKEQGLAEGRAEGRAEGKCEAMREVIIEVLSELGTIPDAITQKINSSTDMEELKKWHKAAISVDSIPAFESMM